MVTPNTTQVWMEKHQAFPKKTTQLSWVQNGKCFLPLPAFTYQEAAAWISADPDFPLLRVGCFLMHSVRGRGGQKAEAATEQQGPSRQEIV